ncbi:MAG: adenine-specific DNA-methyltransferase [Blastocatellia bacterium]
MKYMGSKRAMLQNGLGDLLIRETLSAHRFVDLFAGSGAVATYVAIRFPIPVLAFDLQHYSAVLAGAVINRQTKFKWQSAWKNWRRRAESFFNAYKIPVANSLTRVIVSDFRMWCDQQTELPITQAYGGHYFSPKQTVWIDSLRVSLPKHEPIRTVALAALIQAASQCAAAPGHTAQPFQPTRTAKRFLKEAWDRDIVGKTRTAFELLAAQFAQQRGQAMVADANSAALQMHEGDVAFIDPPYSGVHYSRFYHVLETIADGNCGEVTGVGRYPAREKRPRSKYSVSSESGEALCDLLAKISTRGVRAILTFPDHDCSNGLSGNLVRETATQFFYVREEQVESAFSTLGGTGDKRDNQAGRAARKHAKELMLILEPK